jgi:hypothetical protein
MDLHIGQSEHEFIKITVVDRSSPNAQDFWDGNWLNVKTSILAGNFTANVDGQLRVDEFVTFQKELLTLHKSLTGHAKFETMEHWLKIVLLGDGKGQISLEGEVSDNYENTLRFELILDQTFLPGILEELNQIIQAFPMRGSKENSSQLL